MRINPTHLVGRFYDHTQITRVQVDFVQGSTVVSTHDYAVSGLVSTDPADENSQFRKLDISQQVLDLPVGEYVMRARSETAEVNGPFSEVGEPILRSYIPQNIDGLDAQ